MSPLALHDGRLFHRQTVRLFLFVVKFHRTTGYFHYDLRSNVTPSFILYPQVSGIFFFFRFHYLRYFYLLRFFSIMGLSQLAVLFHNAAASVCALLPLSLSFFFCASAIFYSSFVFSWQLCSAFLIAARYRYEKVIHTLESFFFFIRVYNVVSMYFFFLFFNRICVDENYNVRSCRRVYLWLLNFLFACQRIPRRYISQVCEIFFSLVAGEIVVRVSRVRLSRWVFFSKAPRNTHVLDRTCLRNMFNWSELLYTHTA